MKRLRHLDAVRGVAALVVMLHHAWLSLPQATTQRAGIPSPLLGPLALGRPAVVLFFVLSGFVLTLHLQAARFAPARFAVRRLARILPPYWAAILFAYALLRIAPDLSTSGMSPWLVEQWRPGVSPASLGRHLLLLAGPRQFPLDHVAWSLVHELRLSLLLPLFVLLLRRRGTVAALAVAAAATVGAELYVGGQGGSIPVGIHGYTFDVEGLGPSLVLSARYALAFAVGSVAASHAERIALLFRRSPLPCPAALATSGLLLSNHSEAAMTVGAALLVPATASSARAERVLASPALGWLGRVSYSLYLIHLPIMLACAAWLGGALPPALTVVISMVIALVAAEAMFRLVERPSILLSRAAGAFAIRPPNVRAQDARAAGEAATSRDASALGKA